jgi:hypothetical protein
MIWLLGISMTAVPVMYGYMAVKQKVVVHYAVKEARADEQAKARAKIAEIAEKSEAAARTTIEAARVGAAGVAPTPIEKAELIDLCRKSASCRDRKALKK